jgi:hypothetical protein
MSLKWKRDTVEGTFNGQGKANGEDITGMKRIKVYYIYVYGVTIKKSTTVFKREGGKGG